MCNCIERANKVLAEKSTAIETVMTFKDGVMHARLCVPTRRTDGSKRKSPLRVFASFCPLCGEKISEGKTSSENEQ